MRFIIFLSLFVVFQIQGQDEFSSLSDSICGTTPISDSAATALPWYGNNDYLLSLSDTINSVLNKFTGGDIYVDLYGLDDLRLDLRYM